MREKLYGISRELDDVIRVLESTMKTAYLAFESYYSDANGIRDEAVSGRMLMYNDAVECTTERVEMETSRLRELNEELFRLYRSLNASEKVGAVK